MNTHEAAKLIVAELVKGTDDLYDKPVIHDHDGTVVIGWDGPTNWATNDNYWAFEEVAAMAAEFGAELKYEHKPYFTNPKGFYTEPYDYYTLGVYAE